MTCSSAVAIQKQSVVVTVNDCARSVVSSVQKTTAVSCVQRATTVTVQTGAPGFDGWTPAVAVVPDGARRVLQVVDWLGGRGNKPATGYVGPSGIVPAIGSATDVRGAAGVGIPAGGAAGQVLRKVDAVDYNAAWETLTAADVGAAESSHSHSNATTSVAGFMSAADKTKLDGVASGATANDTDANLKNRANHTGTQAHTTITGLGDAATKNTGTSAGTVAAGDHTHTAAAVGAAPENATLTDAAASSTLPATTSTALTELLQTVRNCLKWLVGNTVQLTGAQTIAGVKTFTDRSSHAGAYTPSAQPAHSATPTFDCATSNVFEPATMTGNVTSITLSNAVAGQTVQIRFQQDATGGRTVAVPSGAKVDGSINTAANRVSWLILTYSSRGSRWEGNWLVIPS